MDMPPEFPDDSAKEFAPLPDEFNRDWQAKATKEEEPSRMRKVMLYLASIGVVTLGVISPILGMNRSDPSDAAVIAMPSATAEAAATPLLTPEPTAQTPADTATSEPTPTPEPTPKVTPIPTPGVNVMYYYRSSEVYYTMLTLSVPEQITGVSYRLTAPNAEEPALSVELTQQQIEDRVYQMRIGDRDEGFDANAYFANHPEADLMMELTYTIQTDAGEETHTETIAPDVEDWVYWRYDAEDDFVGEMMFGQLFPGCFVVRIYESLDPDLIISVGSDEETLKNGDVAISVTIDGREIPADMATPYQMMYRYEGDETVYYDYALVIAIPEDFPQHGTATMTLTRKLLHSDTILIREKTEEY